MWRFRMWMLLLAALLGVGCSAFRRPYANDPLLRHGRGVWGDPAGHPVAVSPPIVEPDAPPAPTPQASIGEWKAAK
jgi:hypothetical protein